jgi:hypothetical protein
MDQKFPDFRPLLSFLNSETNRSLTTQFCGDDAIATLNIMDQAGFTFSVRALTDLVPFTQVFRDGKIPREDISSTLYTMRKLAYSSGQVPASYQVNRQSLSAEATVIARGAFTDVRKGALGGRVVAIRTMGIDEQTDESESKKVWLRLT